MVLPLLLLNRYVAMYSGSISERVAVNEACLGWICGCCVSGLKPLLQVEVALAGNAQQRTLLQLLLKRLDLRLGCIELEFCLLPLNLLLRYYGLRVAKQAKVGIGQHVHTSSSILPRNDSLLSYLCVVLVMKHAGPLCCTLLQQISSAACRQSSWSPWPSEDDQGDQEAAGAAA